MESAALFIVAQTLGLRAGCVLSAVWNQERRKLGLDDPDGEPEAAVDIAVDAARRLIRAKI
jgi:uridine phosphorylase